VLSTACLAFQALAACTGRPPPIRMLTRFKVREIRQTRWTCSAGLAERELGFAPRVTLDAGVERAARWYREHAWL
jgi:nucleoside-diphosphate-sugar epimerase